MMPSDENQNLIYPQTTEELLTYNIKEGHVLLDPKQDLQRLNFDEGNYYINYNFYKTHLSSSLNSKYYIEEISSDRKEIRLNSTTIDNKSKKMLRIKKWQYVMAEMEIEEVAEWLLGQLIKAKIEI
mgnify:CR=1 FL=1